MESVFKIFYSSVKLPKPLKLFGNLSYKKFIYFLNWKGGGEPKGHGTILIFLGKTLENHQMCHFPFLKYGELGEPPIQKMIFLKRITIYQATTNLNK